MQNKVKCRDCRLCDEKEAKCKLTSRDVSVDSERNCKKFARKDASFNG